MINRIIDISDSGYFLRIHQSLLEIQHHGTVKITIVPEDIACLILSHTQTTLTQSVLSTLTQAGAMIMVCDEKHLPSGMMLPFANHQLHTERFAAQCQVSLPLKKQLWKQVITLKIKNQSEVLKHIKGEDGGLAEMSEAVKSGDSDNTEARAAVKYFKRLFGDEFLRHRNAADFNCALNYGYTITRAIIARAICGAGLHPSIGINHHNRYNPFCLADDLIEPYRPIVDFIVASQPELLKCTALTPELKSKLIRPLLAHTVAFPDTRHDIFHAAARTAVSLVNCYMKQTQNLLMPKNFFIHHKENDEKT